MTKNPLISIITPSFNSGKYIDCAIQSVLQQDYDNWEHIIVDGGSTDGTLEILKKYPHLKWVSEPDKGIYDAMNKGIKLAKGEWLYFMGADDLVYDKTTFSEVNKYLFAKYKVVYGNVQFKYSGIMYDGKFTTNKLAKKNICHQAIFYRKVLFKEIGFYDLKYKMLADWHFNMKWFNQKGIDKKYIKTVIATYNENGSCFNITDYNFAEDWNKNIEKYFPHSYHIRQKYRVSAVIRKLKSFWKND